MISFPNAKINIGLYLLRKREDGFHDIESLFYPVSLCDVLEIVKSDTLEFTFSGLDIPGNSESNLCLKAFHVLQKDYDISNVKIHLHKVIPMGAGLGGGSSDASFCINMLNELFGLKIPVKKRIEYASKLGSDCPFFIDNVAAVARGRGEILDAFEINLSGKWIILVNPNIHVSTAEAFADVDVKDSKTDLKDNLAKPLPEWSGSIVNAFEESVFKKHPKVASLKNELYEKGAVYVSMTGSGSTVYGIFENEPDLSFDSYFIWKGKC